MSKKKWYIVLGRVLLLLLISATVMLLLGAEQNKVEKLCTAMDIQIGITQQKGFVDEKEVARAINEWMHCKPEGTAIKNFDLHQTELILMQNVWIKNAQLFFDNNEVLHVQVEQRIPIARIMENKGGSYYLDSTGFKMPLSNNDRADVPVFTNVPANVSTAQVKTLVLMANCINADSFLLAQVAQINMLPAGKFELYPAFGNHVVDLGTEKNMADKLSRLKQFYKKVLVKKGFDAYPKISVAYARQVLAIKGDGKIQQVDGNKAMQAFDQMVKVNRRVANEDADGGETKKRIIKDVIENETITVEEIDKPPDIKNKGNPDVAETKPDKKEAIPKAVMPKSNHN